MKFCQCVLHPVGQAGYVWQWGVPGPWCQYGDSRGAGVGQATKQKVFIQSFRLRYDEMTTARNIRLQIMMSRRQPSRVGRGHRVPVFVVPMFCCVLNAARFLSHFFFLPGTHTACLLQVRGSLASTPLLTGRPRTVPAIRVPGTTYSSPQMGAIVLFCENDKATCRTNRKSHFLMPIESHNKIFRTQHTKKSRQKRTIYVFHFTPLNGQARTKLSSIERSYFSRAHAPFIST